jgi:hypothetical protein
MLACSHISSLALYLHRHTLNHHIKFDCCQTCRLQWIRAYSLWRAAGKVEAHERAGQSADNEYT